ncbi:lysoplasmalogenase [Sphingomonas sp. Leaf357]|uniref:lysoplasmalogenase n=1 Tax=Sphingomonas sp. Leaf357 TaxID=1736350 RepID=UPI000B29C5E0|nr:lysoplasmalogenase [Sphingomonas sp. Leaf357]
MSRLLLICALLAGISFQFVKDGPPGAGLIAWKGAGVALLAIWAASEAWDRKGWLLVAVLAFGALGDVLLETSGTVVGAIAFLIGHVLAITLYLGASRSSLRRSIFATALSACVIAGAAFALTADKGVAVYGLALGGMAGAALASRFDRRLVGLGAVLFVVSDLLIFAKGSALAGSLLPGLLIWPTYFAAQALIAIGVVSGLRGGQGGPISTR